jgi:hypothetical protein
VQHPGGRQAYIPVDKVCPSRRSVRNPERMYTSAKNSCACSPFGVVSVPGAKRRMRVATGPLAASTRSSRPLHLLPCTGCYGVLLTGKNSSSGLGMAQRPPSGDRLAERQPSRTRGRRTR